MTFVPDSHTFDIIAKICRKHEIIPMQAKNWILSKGKTGSQIWVDTRNPGTEFPECCLVGIHMGAELGVQESGHGYTDTTDNLRSEIMTALEKAKPKVPAVQKEEVKPDETKHPMEKTGEDVANKAPQTTIPDSAAKPEVKSEVKVLKVVPPEPKKAIKVPVCSVAECGIEVPHARALDQVTSGNKVMCESCEERAEILKQNEPESQRDAPKPGKINQSIPDAPKAKAEPKTLEQKEKVMSGELTITKPGANVPAKKSDHELDMEIEKAKAKRYLETQGGSYKVNGAEVPDSARIQNIANDAGICVGILESEQNQVFARVRVRGILGKQSVEGEVWVDFDTEMKLLMMEFINKNKGVLDHFEGLDPVFIDGAQIKQGDIFVDAKYALVHAMLTLRKFAIRTATTKASKIVQMKLLNKEFREKEEIAEEKSEQDLVSRSKRK